jgi:cobyrinic acid a,c-diamide synthase
LPLNCPRIVIAGTNSGVGKTSVTLALVSALTMRGLRVQTFKVGPDYLDPTYLTAASGSPCYNLDGWMTGKDYVVKLFSERAKGADIAVIEGVMGLFDGSDPVSRDGSTAEIAAWLGAPVILVVNAHGLARSVAALVNGYASFDPEVKIAGIIANHSGSPRHGSWLAESLRGFGLPGIVASVPRGAFPELPSRHLGLVSADSRILGAPVLSGLGDALESNGSVEEILGIARNAAEIQDAATGRETPHSDNLVRLGIAHDEAFHFYYPDNLEALTAAGCELLEFSPLGDNRLPERLDGLYIGGGYPEEHAEQLSRNEPMLEDIRRFAEAGKVVYAECGGLMYLSQGIESLERKRFEMAGLIPWWTRMLPRRKSLGYAEVTLTKDSLFGKVGTQLRGHEFHYSELVGDLSQCADWRTAYLVNHRRSETPLVEGFQRGRILASYVHTHFASKPDAVNHFVAACRTGGELR